MYSVVVFAGCSTGSSGAPLRTRCRGRAVLVVVAGIAALRVEGEATPATV